MTFAIYFQTEHAMLWHVRFVLRNYPEDDHVPLAASAAAGSACVLACQAALEAIVNALMKSHSGIRHYDELRLRSKIETLADVGGLPIDWGAYPWQELSRLFRLRNWLTHNKENLIGYTGAEGEAITVDGLRLPKFDPEAELSKASVERFYAAVRNAGLELSAMVGEEANYAFLKTEAYEPVIVG